MSENNKNEKYHSSKCGGVPFYPAEHSLFSKRLVGLSDECIKEREKRAIKFLNKHGFDLAIDED